MSESEPDPREYSTVGPGATPIRWGELFPEKPGDPDYLGRTGSLQDEVTIDIRDRWSEEWNQFVQSVVRSRLDLIEMVARIAYSQCLPYGVLVDCDGVRLDKSVPALTIHYRDTDCGPQHTTFTADFTIPE